MFQSVRTGSVASRAFHPVPEVPGNVPERVGDRQRAVRPESTKGGAILFVVFAVVRQRGDRQHDRRGVYFAGVQRRRRLADQQSAHQNRPSRLDAVGRRQLLEHLLAHLFNPEPDRVVHIPGHHDHCQHDHRECGRGTVPHVGGSHRHFADHVLGQSGCHVQQHRLRLADGQALRDPDIRGGGGGTAGNAPVLPDTGKGGTGPQGERLQGRRNHRNFRDLERH